MKKNVLGKTNIAVSSLCFGCLTIGPLQRNLSLEDGERVLFRAMDRGVNFFDTSALYQTYPYLKRVVRRDPEAVLVTKSYDYEGEAVIQSLERALREIGREYIDIFMLHEQESKYTLEGHWEAVEALLKAKRQGKIRAFGISTHRVQAVRDALLYPEIEVVFPLLSPNGIGIEDGSIEDMLAAVRSLRAHGRGVYAMKTLGGGTLLHKRESCFAYAKTLLEEGLVDSVAVGMQSVDEVDYNCDVFENKEPNAESIRRIDKQPRKLHIDDWCEGCGACVSRCRQHALYMDGGKSQVRREKCLACGYCASVCPVFCLKII